MNPDYVSYAIIVERICMFANSTNGNS